MTQQLIELINSPEICAEKGIETPRFKKEDATARIVHIGVGRFHRAHQAVYMQDIMNKGGLDWGICGVCLLPQDQAIIDTFHAQSGYYTLIEKDHQGTSVKIIGSILEMLAGYENPKAVIDRMASESTCIISLTVTEAGYFYQPANKMLLLDHPLVAHDLVNPNAPKTIYGYLCQALIKRQAKDLPLTLASCDNIQGNGDLLRQLLCQFIEVAAPSLLSWVESSVSFPNAMVDRITPAPSEAEAELVKNLGIEDEMPVLAEPFRQWVLENKFANERPIYESVGVQLTDSVEPYEHMKVRLLNAGHSAIGYLGYLANFLTIDGIVQNPQFAQFLEAFLQEAVTTVPAPEGIVLKDYQEALVQRFANPELGDQTLRICKDGSAKITGFIMPSLIELLRDQAVPQAYALVLAAWYQFIAKTTSSGQALDDANADYILKIFDQSNGSITAFYSNHVLFGDLAQRKVFMEKVETFSDALATQATMAVVQNFLNASIKKATKEDTKEDTKEATIFNQ